VDHEGELVTFSGGTELMSQMQVDFQFQPLIWEDGTPVTAEDSVFSFEIAADPDTRIDQHKVEHTESYQAIDELTVRWTGIPGFIDRDYFLNVWQPLPRHILGEYSAAELQNLDEALRRPLANGPFRLEEWIPGERLTLTRNEHYYLADEGLPRVDRVIFRFLIEPARIVDGLLQGECDIAYQDGLGSDRLAELQEADAAGLATMHVVSTPVMEHLDFGVTPSAEYAANRPDWFGSAIVRQAIAQCIDRQALLDSIYAGFGEPMSAYVPAGHPLFPADGRVWEYDPGAANALLDGAGYTDRNGDGIREAPDGAGPFSINLVTSSETEFRRGLAELIAAELLQCGIQVTVDTIPGEQLYANSPTSVLFGRRFDLALFSWLVHAEPACESYQNAQIPGPPPDFPAGWSGNNVTGWANDAFDQACAEALATLPGMEEHVAGHQTALRIFMEELPSLPLFLRIKLTATSPGVQNFRPDVTEPSELWNLYELDITRD
jgi:peptide/nickel transport system substrate-binding protein